MQCLVHDKALDTDYLRMRKISDYERNGSKLKEIFTEIRNTKIYFKN